MDMKRNGRLAYKIKRGLAWAMVALVALLCVLNVSWAVLEEGNDPPHQGNAGPVSQTSMLEWAGMDTNRDFAEIGRAHV